MGWPGCKSVPLLRCTGRKRVKKEKVLQLGRISLSDADVPILRINGRVSNVTIMFSLTLRLAFALSIFKPNILP